MGEGREGIKDLGAWMLKIEFDTVKCTHTVSVCYEPIGLIEHFLKDMLIFL